MKDKKIEIIFNNCKFTTITAGRASHSDVFAFTFNNCTINRFYGSDSTFNRCYFGDSFRDGLVPFANITVNDCYFANLASNDPKGNGGHSDGTQLYGHADTMVEDVLFSNCRFEIPYVKTTQSTAYVNACIMLSLEYNNGKNIKFEDCLVNGGGYSIYAGKAYEDLTLTDVYFTNIKIGAAKMYGNIYPAVDKNVVFTNVEDQDSLYVSSVWNDGANTHIIVSNDTAEERILRIVTGSGYKDFTIKPCLGGNDLRYDNFDLPFEEFPFDIDITIGDKADYVICFDVTDGGEKQIRYVSFNGKPTYYNVNTGDTFPNDPEVDITKIIAEGDCGRNITFTLDSTGKLKLDGTGNMYNYSSNKSAPWFDYADSIVSVEISEGITVIGAQAFRGLKNVESIELPRSLTTIGANAFIGCYGLKTIHIHSAVTVIGDFAFHATRVEKCVYYGTEKMWNDIKIGKKNDYLLSSEKVFKNEKS